MSVPNPIRTLAIVASVVSFGLVGCREEVREDPTMPAPTGPTMPELPPLVLVEAVPQLEVLAAEAPPAPSEERMRELRELMETAWIPDYAPARAVALAQRSLFDADDRAWIFEEGLAHENAAVRMQCAFQLGAMDHRPALPKLAYRLKYEKDPNVQCWVVGALHRLGSHGGLDSLVMLMDRADSAQQAGVTAIEILQAVGRDPGPSPSYTDLKLAIRDLFRQWRRRGVVEVVDTQPPPVADDGSPAEAPAEPRMVTLTRSASLDDMDPLLRARLAEHIASFTGTELRPVDDARFIYNRLGVVGLPLLRVSVPASEPYVRSHSLEIVRDLGRPAAPLVDVVLPMLADPLTATTAMVALGETGAEGVTDHLLARLASDQIELRHAAAWALGPLGDVAAFEPLLARMRDEEEVMDVRVRAASSVAMLDPGLHFLEQTLAAEAYSHPPTLRELIDRVRESRR